MSNLQAMAVTRRKMLEWVDGRMGGWVVGWCCLRREYKLS